MTYTYTFDGKTYEVTIKEVPNPAATTESAPKPKKTVRKVLPIIIVQL